MATFFALLLLVTSASGCFQCNSKIVELFKKIRTEALPLQFRDSKLRNRCDKLLKGMASNFFKDYAVNHFTGLMEIHHYNTLVDYIQIEAMKFLHSKDKDQDFLDAMMRFRIEITRKFKHDLKIFREKACSPTECGWLKLDVFSCKTCKTVKPTCLSHQVCKGKGEIRYSLTFHEEDVKATILKNGLSTVGISAVILLIALSILTLMYWMRKKSFTERTMVV